MELHTLERAPGSTKAKKRKGRGQGSGKGGTSTKGHKGAQSRSGYKTKAYHTGGTTPLQRSKPKFGFKNPAKKEVIPISLDQIALIAQQKNISEITPAILVDLGVIKKNQSYKILAGSSLVQKIDVHAPSFSTKAKDMIIEAGGSTHNV